MSVTRERDFLFDNIKGFLIILVVLGHVIENYAYNNVSSTVSLLYQLIYIFHMPLFVFVSGYFSKKDNPKKLAELIIIYFLFQLVFFPLLASFIKGDTYLDNVQSFFKPKFTYWYMLSLVGWRVFNPILTKIKFIIPLSIVAGVLIGLTPGKDSLSIMSIGRSVSFYPFFLVGYLTTKENIDFLREKISMKKAFLLLVVITFISYAFLNCLYDFVIKDKFIYYILFGRDRYSLYLLNPNYGIIFRFVLYLIQFIFICALISLFTYKKTILFNLSINSLFIYLTHGVFVDSLDFKYYDKFNVSDINLLSFMVISLIISLSYCFLLSFKPLSKIGEFITKIPSYLILNEKKEQN